MTDEEKREFVKAHGWETYYNPAYWVHPKTVSNPRIQDYTNYGMSLDDAVVYEQKSLPPIKSYGLPEIGKVLFAIEHHEDFAEKDGSHE